MKKNLLILSLATLGLSVSAQSPRLSLFEEFTGENCGPCASTNPGLNNTLKNNVAKVVAIKWQVPIPSAPSATWSLYRTNKTEIDWRWRSSASGSYGYNSQYDAATSPVPGGGINSAPQGRLDGQHLWTFGATNDHGGYATTPVISAAQSHTSAFSISMTRDWNATGTAITLTVNIQATAPFTAVGSLVFRTVMVEKEIIFATAPGSNGEKEFHDVAIASFPSIQTGVAMAGSWTVGQTQTFTLNCPIPSYTRKKEEIAFVGFIQDDGDQKVAQAARADKAKLTNDAVAMAASVPVTCNASISPVVTIFNNGVDPITAMTITPSSDAVAGPVTVWTGNLAAGASTTVALNPMTAGTTPGSHLFSYNITALNAVDFNLTNNTGKVTYVVASSSQGTPVSEGFVLGAFPPAGFTAINSDGGAAGWSRTTQVGAYNTAPLQSCKYDFFNNTVIGDKDELFLPPIDLDGGNDPEMYFDLAYAQRSGVENDALEVLASSDCGATWVSVYNYSGSSLSTSSTGPMMTSFIPTAADWRTEMFTLPGFNKPNVLVKFVVTNDNGNNLYLDNINLAQANPVGIAKINGIQMNVSLYPNPTNGITNLSITSKKTSAAKISVVNMIGQVIDERTINLAEGTNNIMLDTKEYASGVYHVSVNTANGSVVKKLNVTK